MTAPDLEISKSKAKPEGVQPLHAGDSLTRPEFHRLYSLQPENIKAELIDGVVYMPPLPISVDSHAAPHGAIMAWLGRYWAETPGTTIIDNGTFIIDMENEVQPDAVLFLVESAGGKSSINTNGYLEGIPELIIEVSASSATYDLHQKKRMYGRIGVPEYLVIKTYEKAITWFAIEESGYKALLADEKNIYCSRIFPGLWLDEAAFWADRREQLFDTFQNGLNSPEYKAFLQRLGVS